MANKDSISNLTKSLQAAAQDMEALLLQTKTYIGGTLLWTTTQIRRLCGWPYVRVHFTPENREKNICWQAEEKKIIGLR